MDACLVNVNVSYSSGWRHCGAVHSCRTRQSGAEMKIGLIGLAGGGKTTVFGALTGLIVETGYAGKAGKENLGAVKVPDARVDALAQLYMPKKITYAEVQFTDLGGGYAQTLERESLNSMRNVDALCHVIRGFTDVTGNVPDQTRDLEAVEGEILLADLDIVEQRIARLTKDHSNQNELELQTRLKQALESEMPLRDLTLNEEELRMISGYAFLTLKPMLLVHNVNEENVVSPIPVALQSTAKERGLGLVQLSGVIEMEIAQMALAEQAEFVEALGLDEPARNRFIRSAFELIDLISMLTAGPDECRAWPVRRGSPAPKAAGKIHSDIERGFIRAEVMFWKDLVTYGSEGKCRDAGVLRVEGKEYIVQDGDVVNFRFNV